MAKLEIPSIVVQSGSHTPPSMANTRSQWSLSNQSTYEEETEPVTSSTSETDQAPNKEEDGKEIPPTPPSNNNNLPRSRSKANLKLLKRSHAIKESTSPPPDISLSPVNSPIPTSADPAPSVNNNNNSTTVNSNLPSKPSIKREESNDSNWSSSFSRGNSFDCTDSSGVDVESFIIETINKSAKDRMFLLRIENELVTFTKDPKKSTYKFGTMSSYQRMMVHRVAHYFGLDHNVDATGHMVVVNKIKGTRLPETRFSEFIRDDCILSEEPRRSILKRDSASFEDTVTFKGEFNPEEEDELSWGRSSAWQESDFSKLHPNSHRQSRLTKVESYEGKDTLRANSLRSSVSKSFSFGGYDQNSTNNKVLTKQDSGSSVSSRVSPSSSGYKSQSQRSDTTMSATPSPTATPNLPNQLPNQGALSPDPDRPVLWAVSNIAAVPPGSLLINPETMRAFVNDDGSVYHYDPENPPPRLQNNPPSRAQTEIDEAFRNLLADGGNVDGGTSSHRRSQTEAGSATMNDTSRPSQMLAFPAATQTNQSPAEVHAYAPENNTEPDSGHSMQMPQQPPCYHPVPPALPLSSLSTMTQPPPMNGTAAPYQNPQPYNMFATNPSVDPNYLVPSTSQQMMYQPPNTQYPPMPPVHHYDRNYTNGFMGTPAAPVPVPIYFPPQNVQPPVNGQPPRYSCYPPQLPPERPAEVSYPQQPIQPVHSYFTRCPTNTQVGAMPSYCTATGAAGGMMGLVQLPPAPLPPAQPPRPFHRMSTPPATPQNGGPQYSMYSNGYSVMPNCFSQYQAPTPPAQLSLPTMLRPGLQLRVCNSPPLRSGRAPAAYSGAGRSHVAWEPGPSDNHQPSPSPIRFTAAAPQHLPLVRITYPANELFLLNASRAPFTSPAGSRCQNTAAGSTRRQRPRPGGSTPATNRPAATMGAASQQQAAFAAAIETAGLQNAGNPANWQ